jgi:hypothetical protein
MNGITAQYLDPLILRQIGHRRWVLVHEFRFNSSRLRRRLIVDAGRETDLASYPETPLAKWIAADYGQAASVLHDEAYRLRLGREAADTLFLEAMETDGSHLGIPRVPAWRRRLMYAAVRGWGASHYDAG